MSLFPLATCKKGVQKYNYYYWFTNLTFKRLSPGQEF